MATRYDWYYEQLVLEDELDNAFDALEVADRAIISDTGLCRDDSNEAEFGGIFWGLAASHLSGLDMKVDNGAGYDGEGRRVAQGAGAGYLIVTPSATGSTSVGAGGTPTGGTSTSPSDGYERWVTIFIVYDRLLSDPRYDGYNVLVYFNRTESFHYEVSMGAEKTIGNLLDSDKPARQDGKLLVTDVRIKNVGGVVTYVSHSSTRREIFFNVTASGSPGKQITGETVRDVLKSMLQLYNDHVGGTADQHPAADLTYSGGKLWADGTGGFAGAATTVQAGIDGIIDDLTPTTEVAGAKRIGAKAQTGSLAIPAMAALSLSAGTLESQLTAILTALNGRIFRGGDSGIGGALKPATDGTALGDDSYSWDAYLRDFKAKGALKSNLMPGTDMFYDLGSASLRWGEIHGGDVNSFNTLAKNSLAVGGGGTVTPPVTVDVAGIQIWGISATYPTGCANMANDGYLTLKNGASFQPAMYAGWHKPFELDGSKLETPNRELWTLTGQRNGGYGVEVQRLDAFGVVWERGFSDNFQGFRRNANLLTTGGIPNQAYVGSGAQIYRSKYPFEGLVLLTGGVYGDTAYLGGPGNIGPLEPLMLMVSVIPYNLTDTTLFVGVTGEADSLLPSFQPGFDDFIGISFTPSLGANWHIVISDKAAGHAELNTGIAVTTGSTSTFYIYWDGDTNLYWWKSGSWQTWAPASGKSHSDGFRLYAHIVNAGASSKSVALLNWSARGTAWSLP
jgi:hypothetical protein